MTSEDKAGLMKVLNAAMEMHVAATLAAGIPDSFADGKVSSYRAVLALLRKGGGVALDKDGNTPKL